MKRHLICSKILPNKDDPLPACWVVVVLVSLWKQSVASSNNKLGTAEAVESFSIIMLSNFGFLRSVSRPKALLPAVLQLHQMKVYWSKVLCIAIYAGFGQCWWQHGLLKRSLCRPLLMWMAEAGLAHRQTQLFNNLLGVFLHWMWELCLKDNTHWRLCALRTSKYM